MLYSEEITNGMPAHRYDMTWGYGFYERKHGIWTYVCGENDSFPAHGLSEHLFCYSAQRLDLLAWCVRLNRFSVANFRTRLKSTQFQFNLFH